MELISVIVPVYKVEPYLDKCVSSIVGQTYKDLEIILVDDGSPDRCPEICDAWAEKDSRIKVIHKKNMGGGAARNIGIDIAKGELMAFVDSDDYLSPNMYEFLFNAMQETDADIVECGYIKVEGDDADFTSSSMLPSTYTPTLALSAHINDSCFSQLVWNKLYRRNVIGNIRYPIGTKIDDEFFTYQLIGRARLLAVIPDVLYAYRQQSASVMHSVSAQKCIDAINAKLERHVYISANYPELTNKSLINLWFSSLYQGQRAIREFDDNTATAILLAIKNATKNQLLPAKGKIKDKVWSCMAKYSFIFTCKLRNTLKIGL